MSNLTINPGTSRSVEDLSDLTFQQIKQTAANRSANDVQLPDEKISFYQKNPARPDVPPSENVDFSSLPKMVGTLSPGAAFAALCIKEALAQNEQNQKQLLAQGEAVAKEMNDQADNISRGALKQMLASIAAGVFTAVGSAVASVKTLKLDANVSTNEFTQLMVPANNWQTAGKSLAEGSNSIGAYLNAREQADNKRLDAQIEWQRTAMENLKTSMQAQRDLVNKAIDFMNSMQANMNQTRTKILA
ncbi:MAG: hypothetical protein IJT59_03560 [Desulfovibrionaceae bacterium]|nr:hypothetical protein [Desulfovibrionaceae bacterium]